MKSLLKQADYSQAWVKDFYTQAGIWWGTDPQEHDTHKDRVETIGRLCGSGPKRILDLGCGPGRTAAALADAGHTVIGVEMNPIDSGYARELLRTPHKGSLSFLEDNFYTVCLRETFDVVTCWQVFGIGSDTDQRRILRRISQEWLAPEGSVLLDVYNPMGPARDNGREWTLEPLEGISGSVEMIESCRYDAIQGRWIDEWQPTADPEKALAQTMRCYTPADLLLLLEGTGLRLRYVEIDHTPYDMTGNRRTTSTDLFKNDYNYLVQLIHI